MKGWTYGAEHEFVDWDRRRPHTWNLDTRDVTMVNSCGIAVDPKAKLFHLGGEINTYPTATPEGQGAQVLDFLQKFPEANVNYRSNLHVHVRIPGLRDSLPRLKLIQRFCNKWLPKLLPLIEPIPEPTQEEYPDVAAYRGARRRYARRKVSHHKILAPSALLRQTEARTFEEFINAEALTNGKLLWHTKPRCAVNLRQLVQTDTIEFRHFPGTLSASEVVSAVSWCRDFLELALSDGDPWLHWEGTGYFFAWPKFCPYDHALETTYQMTAAHIVGPEVAAANIAKLWRQT